MYRWAKLLKSVRRMNLIRLGLFSCSCEGVFLEGTRADGRSQHTSAALSINENYDPGKIDFVSDVAYLWLDVRKGGLEELRMDD